MANDIIDGADFKESESLIKVKIFNKNKGVIKDNEEDSSSDIELTTKPSIKNPFIIDSLITGPFKKVIVGDNNTPTLKKSNNSENSLEGESQEDSLKEQPPIEEEEGSNKSENHSEEEAPENTPPKKYFTKLKSEENSHKIKAPFQAKKAGSAPEPDDTISEIPDSSKRIDIPKEEATEFLEAAEAEQPEIKARFKSGVAPQLALVPMTNIGFMLINCIPGGQILGIVLLGSIMKILPKFPKLKEEMQNKMPEEVFEIYEKDDSKYLGNRDNEENFGDKHQEKKGGTADPQANAGAGDRKVKKGMCMRGGNI